MRRLINLIDAFGRHKDGIAVIAGLFLGIVGLFQYLEFRSDREIGEALKMLERREKGEVQKAIVAFEQLWRPLLAEGGVNDGTQRRAAELILADPKKQDILTTLSFYYNSVSSCALEGICDRTILCSSLTGTIQDYLSRNRHYFAGLGGQSAQAGKRLYLTMPEFVDICGDNLGLYILAQHDSSFRCQASLYSERLIGLGVNNWCKSAASEYDCKVLATQVQITGAVSVSLRGVHDYCNKRYPRVFGNQP